jgi:hypothetical protein
MGTTARRKPDPDRLLCAWLSGAAMRLARAGGSITDAVAELRQLADGRDDLLAQEAGVLIGAWSAHPDTDTGHRVLAASLLVVAGADLDALDRWVDEGRRRAEAPMHSA